MKESYRLYDEGCRAHTKRIRRSVVVPTNKGAPEPFVSYVLKQYRDVIDARASSTLGASALVSAILFTYETATRRVLGTESPLVIYVTRCHTRQRGCGSSTQREFPRRHDDKLRVERTSNVSSIERDEMRHRGVDERRARGLDIEPSVANSGVDIQKKNARDEA